MRAMATNEEDIEIQLWEYIDGLCNTAAAERIGMLLAHDDVWQRKYSELQALHTGILKATDIEQPSLRFSKNVMEAIAAAHPALAPKRYLNPMIIGGIAAFFIISIGLVLAFALITADWRTATSATFSLPKIKLHSVFGGAYLNVLLAVNVMLGLVLLDYVLRRKRVQHH